jgi:DNA-directed RNA polymerase subunit RPC12/RpoP
MKFKCQNCNWKFQKEIKNLDERKQVLCPECFSKIVRFAGAGFYPEQELREQKEEKEKQENLNMNLEKQKELIDMIEHKNKLQKEEKEQKEKQEKQKEYMEAQELIDMIEHKNKLIDERLKIW